MNQMQYINGPTGAHTTALSRPGSGIFAYVACEMKMDARYHRFPDYYRERYISP